MNKKTPAFRELRVSEETSVCKGYKAGIQSRKDSDRDKHRVTRKHRGGACGPQGTAKALVEIQAQASSGFKAEWTLAKECV